VEFGFHGVYISLFALKTVLRQKNRTFFYFRSRNGGVDLFFLLIFHQEKKKGVRTGGTEGGYKLG
jgi:hypothetical protein